MTNITRLGLCGFSRPRYGDFSGRTPIEPDPGITPAGKPLKLVILPDGKRVYLTDRQVEELRLRLSREQPTKKQARRIKKLAKKELVLAVPESLSIQLPPVFQAIPVDERQQRIEAAIRQILRNEEEDTLTLLLMLS